MARTFPVRGRGVRRGWFSPVVSLSWCAFEGGPSVEGVLGGRIDVGAPGGRIPQETLLMDVVFLQLRHLSDGRVRASVILAGGGITHQGGSLDGNDQVSSRYDRLPPFIGPVLGGVDDARRTLDVGGLVLDDHESIVGALHPAVLSIAEIQAAGCAVPVGWS